MGAIPCDPQPHDALRQHQKELIRALNDNFPEFQTEKQDIEKLSALPKFGSIQIASGFWGFHVHGRGVRFVNIGTMEVVDMEDNISDPEHVSPYRLSNYEESL